MSKLAIRKALESALASVMEANGIAYVFGDDKLDTSEAPITEYVRASVTFGEDHATEVGGNPRIERSGKFHIGVNTEPRLKQDRNDVVVGLVRSAYPYGVDLERDGIRVSIETADDSDCRLEGSFLYAPVYVKFMVWSTTNV